MSEQPAPRRGQTADLMRELFAHATCPLSVREIVVATGMPRNNVKTILNKWTQKGALIRTGTPGHGDVGGYTYSQGPKRLRVVRYDRTPEEKAAAKRERYRQRKARCSASAPTPRPPRTSKRAPAPPTCPVKLMRQPKLARARVAAAATSKSGPRMVQAPAIRETVEDFLKRGGHIEQLPGMKKDYRIAPRRPSFPYHNRLGV